MSRSFSSLTSKCMCRWELCSGSKLVRQITPDWVGGSSLILISSGHPTLRWTKSYVFFPLHRSQWTVTFLLNSAKSIIFYGWEIRLYCYMDQPLFMTFQPKERWDADNASAWSWLSCDSRFVSIQLGIFPKVWSSAATIIHHLLQ